MSAGCGNGDIERTLCTAEAICAAKGSRLTAQRRRVLEILCAGRRPMGAYEILERLALRAKGVKPPTVYRALDFLQSMGLVHRLESLNAFLGCVNPDHPHAGQFLICRDCGRVEEMEDPGVERRLGEAVSATGFLADSRVIEVTGRCADCSRPKGGKHP